MRSITSGLENALPHMVYDLSLPIEERREKAIRFSTAKAAAKFLGISPERVTRYRLPGKRIERHGTVYAIRIATSITK